MLLIKKKMPLGKWLFPSGELQLKSDEDGLANVVFGNHQAGQTVMIFWELVGGSTSFLPPLPAASLLIFKATVEVGEADGKRAI